MGLIQFADLAHLVAELPAGHVVRVETLETVEGVDKGTGVRRVGIGVHVRAFTPDGHILAGYIPTARLQLIGQTDLDDPGGTAGRYDAAWEEARTNAERVRAYLARRGLDVRRGTIDLGDARPLAGGWREDDPPPTDQAVAAEVAAPLPGPTALDQATETGVIDAAVRAALDAFRQPVARALQDLAPGRVSDTAGLVEEFLVSALWSAGYADLAAMVEAGVALVTELPDE